MSAALMFAARHLTRYLTAAARTNGNAPSRPADVCESAHVRVYHRRIPTYSPCRPRIVREGGIAYHGTPSSIVLSIARLDTRHDSVGPPCETPPLDCALRPPADDTVCKQRKNATRLFSPAIQIVVGRR